MNIKDFILKLFFAASISIAMLWFLRQCSFAEYKAEQARKQQQQEQEAKKRENYTYIGETFKDHKQ